MPMKATNYIIGLDVLRMMAALLVVCYHFCFWYWMRGMPFSVGVPVEATRLAVNHPWWHRHLHCGWIGVEIFFVISGFVIAWTASEATSASFARSRFLRLAPGELDCCDDDAVAEALAQSGSCLEPRPTVCRDPCLLAVWCHRPGVVDPWNRG